MQFFVFAAYDPHLNVLTFPPLTGGCSEGLDAFRFFFQRTKGLLYYPVKCKVDVMRKFKEKSECNVMFYYEAGRMLALILPLQKTAVVVRGMHVFTGEKSTGTASLSILM